MSRVSPGLKRRPVRHEIETRSRKSLSPQSAQHIHECSDEEDMEMDEGESNDILEVDNEDEDSRQPGLYPDPDKLKHTVESINYGNVTARSPTKKTVDPIKSESFLSMRSLWAVAIGIFILIVVVCLNFLKGPVESVSAPTPEIVVSKLKKEYVNQPSLSFRIIQKALDNVIALNRSEPSAPAILLLMSTKGAKETTTSFAEQLARLVASGDRNYQTIYGDELRIKDPDRAKKEIDDTIKDAAMSQNRKFVVLIRDLDVIPPNAVMMLHGYCDHENAPFKNAVFIMTIDANAELRKCDSKQFDEAAESHLTRMWSDLSKDMLSALLSRITVSVVAINHKTRPAICN